MNRWVATGLLIGVPVTIFVITVAVCTVVIQAVALRAGVMLDVVPVVACSSVLGAAFLVYLVGGIKEIWLAFREGWAALWERPRMDYSDE